MSSSLDVQFREIFHRSLSMEEIAYMKKNYINNLSNFCSKFDESLFNNKPYDIGRIKLLRFFKKLNIDDEEVLYTLRFLEQQWFVTNLDELIKLKQQDLQSLQIKPGDAEKIYKQILKIQQDDIPKDEQMISKSGLLKVQSDPINKQKKNEAMIEEQDSYLDRNQETPQYQQELLQLKNQCQKVQPNILLYPSLDRQNMKANADEFQTIMVVGEVGSGKTSFLNYLLNYFHGIRQEQQERFVFNYPFQQTKYCKRHYVNPFNGKNGLRIIDTPGIGNEREPNVSKQIIDLIFEQLLAYPEITCICFVIQSQNARLTQTQNFLFHYLFQQFGDNILQNIKFIFTFCDQDCEPKSLEALKFKGDQCNVASLIAHQIEQLQPPYYFTVNSLNFITASQMDKSLKSFFWNLTMKNIDQFYSTLIAMRPYKLNQNTYIQKIKEKVKLTKELQDNIILAAKLITQIKESEKKFMNYNTIKILDKNNYSQKYLYSLSRCIYYDLKKKLIEAELKCYQLIEEICKLENTTSFFEFMEQMIIEHYNNNKKDPFRPKFKLFKNIIQHKFRAQIQDSEYQVIDLTQ